ncbi:hypothetical protein [Ensifer aridi]|uniref:hypothetical protein n=1 Tax=Ensifer aridi TaxID=1708715 RepID=UPI0009C0A402|nr:hypothetical protein [Ensifer aridi]
MGVYLTGLVSLLLAALSLGPSFAHVLEAPPRLFVWSPELWREATVFNGQFAFFAKVGAPLDLGAILAASLLSYLLASERPAFWFALAGAGLLAAGLAAWVTLVAPANALLATWKPGPIPPDFEAVRLRWETGHMVVAAAKVMGFASIALALLAPRLASGSP